MDSEYDDIGEFSEDNLGCTYEEDENYNLFGYELNSNYCDLSKRLKNFT